MIKERVARSLPALVLSLPPCLVSSCDLNPQALTSSLPPIFQLPNPQVTSQVSKTLDITSCFCLRWHLHVESCQHTCCGLPTHCLATDRLRKGHLGNKNPGTPPGELHLAGQTEQELLSVQGVPIPWHHDLEDTESKSSASEMQMQW